MVRPDRETAGKDGDVTEMFAEAIKVPACVMPAAEEPAQASPRPAPQPAPVLAEVKPAAARAARLGRARTGPRGAARRARARAPDLARAHDPRHRRPLPPAAPQANAETGEDQRAAAAFPLAPLGVR